MWEKNHSTFQLWSIRPDTFITVFLSSYMCWAVLALLHRSGDFAGGLFHISNVFLPWQTRSIWRISWTWLNCLQVWMSFGSWCNSCVRRWFGVGLGDSVSVVVCNVCCSGWFELLVAVWCYSEMKTSNVFPLHKPETLHHVTLSCGVRLLMEFGVFLGFLLFSTLCI